MFAKRYVPIGVILTVFAVNAPVSVSADRHDPPSDDVVAPRRPPAQREHLGGAPHYLHFGPTGLCVIGDGFDWSEVPAGGMALDEASRVLAIEGSYDFDTVVDIQPVDQGTDSPYDDEVRVTVTVYTNPNQMIFKNIVAEEFPMWDAGSADLDQETTQNTPQSLYLERIEYRGAPDEVPTALTNNTRVPMHATGWFAQVLSGENGFHGGGGPDCVEASLLDDVVDTGGGDDYAKLKDGNNVAFGGDGNDTLQATLGQDLLFGEDGLDLLQGGNDDDCLDGGHDDGLRDVLDDANNYDFDSYLAEPGVIDGELVGNIEIITSGEEAFATNCS